MQGPAWPRGTGFAEQAAIQYFVFSSLFNAWPQAKPCSEYRTGAFLTGFSTGSPRAVARQFTSTFIVKHPHFPNWKLNREIGIASSCPSEQLCEDPQGPGFLGHFTCSKHKSCWCLLWLCTTSISAAQTRGSYPGKKSVWGIDSLGSPITRWPERDLLTGHWAADSSQEWSKFSNVVFIAPFVCLLTSATSEQKSYRNHFLLFPAHT